MSKRFTAVAHWMWRQFRRLPLVLQWAFGATAVGAVAMPVFVGSMGLALMGTAISLSGWAVGAVIGFFAVIGSWAGAIVVRVKRQR